MSETKKPIKAGDLGKVIDELGLLKDSVLGGDFMGIFSHSKSIADEFWTALYPSAPVPGSVIEARFRLSTAASQPFICTSKEDLAARIDEVKEYASLGDGKWAALFAKLLPIILTLLAG